MRQQSTVRGIVPEPASQIYGYHKLTCCHPLWARPELGGGCSLYYLMLTLRKGSSCLFCCRAAWWQHTGTDGRASVSFFTFRQSPSLLLLLTNSPTEFFSWYKDTKSFLFTPGNNYPCSLQRKRRKGVKSKALIPYPSTSPILLSQVS